MKKKRVSITKDIVDTACLLLDSWSNKLTWARFLAVLETEIGYRYTKMAFRSYPEVLSAFAAAKKRLRKAVEDAKKDAGSIAEAPAEYGDVALANAYSRIARLENTIARLKGENHNLLERFMRWQSNAMARGVNMDILDRPLPKTKRSH